MRQQLTEQAGDIHVNRPLHTTLKELYGLSAFRFKSADSHPEQNTMKTVRQFYSLCIDFETHSQHFDFSARSICHVMFWFAGTAQEAGAGG